MFLILSYFYGFLILRSEQVAGTYSVARPLVADPEGLWICIHVYVRVCSCVCTCIC